MERISPEQAYYEQVIEPEVMPESAQEQLRRELGGFATRTEDLLAGSYSEEQRGW